MSLPHFTTAYNDIIIDAANQLRTIDELTAPVKAARLRSILAQLKESLAGWAGDATEITALELQGLTELQSEFVTDQLRRVLPAGSRDAVRTETHASDSILCMSAESCRPP